MKQRWSLLTACTKFMCKLIGPINFFISSILVLTRWVFDLSSVCWGSYILFTFTKLYLQNTIELAICLLDCTFFTLSYFAPILFPQQEGLPSWPLTKCYSRYIMIDLIRFSSLFPVREMAIRYDYFGIEFWCLWSFFFCSFN